MMASSLMCWRQLLRDVEIEGGRARARLDEDGALQLCEGHFTGEPFLPGAYTLRLLSDLGALLLERTLGWPHVARTVERSMFRAKIDPRRPAELEVVMASSDGAALDGRVHVAGELAVSARFAFEGMS